MKTHTYRTNTNWTGNLGKGTENYRSYDRSHTISAVDKTSVIEGSSDPSFRGDKSKYNPEELLVSSISACHMLWYLHLCSEHNIIVLEYSDNAIGEMIETADGGGRFGLVTLYPAVTIASDSDEPMAIKLHLEAHEKCFIANSCNFPIKIVGSINKKD